MNRRSLILWLLVLLVGCGPFKVASPGQENNCERAAQIAATGAPHTSLDLGSVRPPLPNGLDEPRGIILPPQTLIGPVAADAANVGVPDPDRRKES